MAGRGHGVQFLRGFIAGFGGMIFAEFGSVPLNQVFLSLNFASAWIPLSL
jgi:hypothetical protein